VINGIPLKDPQGAWPWVVKHFPTLAAEALKDDIFIAEILFPKNEGHTISYQIACMALKGNRTAKKLCEALNFLTPGHCVEAIANEGGVCP
jgi:hypothetical protein